MCVHVPMNCRLVALWLISFILFPSAPRSHGHLRTTHSHQFRMVQVYSISGRTTTGASYLAVIMGTLVQNFDMELELDRVYFVARESMLNLYVDQEVPKMPPSIPTL